MGWYAKVFLLISDTWLLPSSLLVCHDQYRSSVYKSFIAQHDISHRVKEQDPDSIIRANDDFPFLNLHGCFKRGV
jgi:hypothetical protein